MKGTRIIVIVAVLASIAAPATPQTSASALGFRGVGSLGLEMMSASESFDAVVGKSSLEQFGGGVQVVNLWRSLFAEVTVERSHADGERVFVFNGDVFPLGTPIKVSQTPIDVVAGWRFLNRTRLTPYAGAGFTSVGYREESQFAQDDDDVRERGSGYLALGGVEVRAWRWIHMRGEVRFRNVPDVLGLGGVSAAFDETSLGGLTYGVKLAIGRRE